VSLRAKWSATKTKEQLEELNEELEKLNAEARELQETIARNVAEILDK
jgi:type I restriction enzyme M protein